jgi:hypothetical protein
MGGGLGGFYKGEKKKKKKDSKSISSASIGIGTPIFFLPKIIEKKKKDF